MRNKTHLKAVVFCVIISVLHSSYSFAGTWTTIDATAYGADMTQIYKISGSNMLGRYYHPDESCTGHSFIYNGTSWETIIMPGTNDTFDTTYATDIDGKNIVGFYYGSTGSNGFLYNGSSWTIINMPGSASSGNWGATVVNCISGSNLVGTYNDAYDVEHFFLYNGSSWTTLDIPLPGEYFCLTSIDGSNIVGCYDDNSKLGVRHGLLYNGTTWTTLDMPGATYTEIMDIDGSNIVGTYVDTSGKGHGFLYDGANWTTLDMPGAYSTCVSGIDGLNIVGSYNTLAYSSVHGFIYTIPEPATLLLLGLGMAAMRKKQR